MIDTIMAENRVAPEKLDILASLSQPTITRRQRKGVVMDQKWCNGCKQTKVRDEFHDDRTKPDGKCSQCKKCRSISFGRYRENNLEKRAENYKRWAENNRDKVAAYDAKSRKLRPERHRVRGDVKTAILQGKLVRPDHCEDCGGTPVHSHHDDYSKPLEVRWLCPKCHAKADKERREHECMSTMS